MPLRSLREAVGTWSPGRGAALEPLAAIAAAWPGIVGASVAANSRPLALSGEALVVVTSSSAWSQQLQLLSPPILRALGALGGLPPVTRLTFRAGTVGERRRRPFGGPVARRTAEQRQAPALPAAALPAADSAEALARLRSRMTALRRAAAHRCLACEAPLEAAADRCAPCAGSAERERAVRLQRLIYAAPWLGPAEIAEQLPATTAAEYERARRTLLQRWWNALERARRTGRLTRAGDERGLASSYVLLESRLAPERVTPAVVRNLLGADLEALLWPSRAHPAPVPTAHAQAYPASVPTAQAYPASVPTAQPYPASVPTAQPYPASVPTAQRLDHKARQGDSSKNARR